MVGATESFRQGSGMIIIVYEDNRPIWHEVMKMACGIYRQTWKNYTVTSVTLYSIILDS